MAYVKPAADFSLLEEVIVAKRTITLIDGQDGNGTNTDLSNENTEAEGDE